MNMIERQIQRKRKKIGKSEHNKSEPLSHLGQALRISHWGTIVKQQQQQQPHS